MAGDFDRWLGRLSDDERLDVASARLEEISKRVHVAIHLFENNRQFVFDKDFDQSVPASEARVMFQFLQHTLVRSLIIEICKIWDSPGDRRDSLPTIIGLICKPEILDLQRERQIQRLQRGRNMAADEEDPELAAWMKSLSGTDDASVADERRELLRVAAARVLEVAENNAALARLREFRDRNIAHSLSSKPRKEDWPFYGDAGDVLAVTEPLMTDLMQVLCYGSPSWDEYHRIASERTRFLWNGCVFAVQANEGL